MKTKGCTKQNCPQRHSEVKVQKYKMITVYQLK